MTQDLRTIRLKVKPFSSIFELPNGRDFTKCDAASK
jgi:hypothetical protein